MQRYLVSYCSIIDRSIDSIQESFRGSSRRQVGCERVRTNIAITQIKVVTFILTCENIIVVNNWPIRIVSIGAWLTYQFWRCKCKKLLKIKNVACLLLCCNRPSASRILLHEEESTSAVFVWTYIDHRRTYLALAHEFLLWDVVKGVSQLVFCENAFSFNKTVELYFVSTLRTRCHI